MKNELILTFSMPAQRWLLYLVCLCACVFLVFSHFNLKIEVSTDSVKHILAKNALFRSYGFIYSPRLLHITFEPEKWVPPKSSQRMQVIYIHNFNFKMVCSQVMASVA